MIEPKIVNKSGKNLEPVFKSLREFYPFFKERHPFDVEPTFNFISDPENGNKVLGNTAYYDPSSYTVTIYVDDRHPKDILRSISHELIHHVQNCRGDLTGPQVAYAGEQGYAQKNDHLRKMESEAYHDGDFAVRDWTDGLDEEFKSSFTIYEQVVKKTVKMLLNETIGIEGPAGTFQGKMRRGHSKLKSRIIKTGANKTKATPFKKGASSKRAKSAPPSAGSALEENGEFIMNEEVIEEIVQNVLKRLSEAEVKNKEKADLDDDGELSSYEKKRGAAIEKAMADDDKEKDEKVNESQIKSQIKTARKHGDIKEVRRLKKELNLSSGMKKALSNRKKKLNSKLMEKWFKIKE